MKSNELSDLLEEYELEPKSNKELRIQSIERFLETNDSEEDIDPLIALLREKSAHSTSP